MIGDSKKPLFQSSRYLDVLYKSLVFICKVSVGNGETEKVFL